MLLTVKPNQQGDKNMSASNIVKTDNPIVKEDKPVLSSIVQELNAQLDNLSSETTYTAKSISKINTFFPLIEDDKESIRRENDLVSILADMIDRLRLYNQRLVDINKHLNNTI